MNIQDRIKLLEKQNQQLNSQLLKEAINYNKHIWEGWTVQDFIDDLTPMFNQIMSGGSWKKKFETKEDLKKWCMDNQPYYKKYIKDVVEHFAQRANLK